MSVQVKGSGTIGGLDEGLVVSGIVTSSTQINVGSNIQLGNAGVITATSFVGAFQNSGDFTIDDYVVHAGDTNTKFGFPAADTITAETAGAERARIDSNGRLSFAGDTDTYIHHPEDNELAITVSGGSQPIARFGTGGNNATVGINTDGNLVTNSEILSVRGYSSFKSLNDGYAAIYTHNEDQGNSTIASHILFNVGGANRGGFGYDTDNSTLIMGNQTNISFKTGATQLGGTERLRIRNDGNVGIGTDAPTEKFNVFGTNVKPVIGHKTAHTVHYSSYDSQNNTTLEISSSGTGTNVAGLALNNPTTAANTSYKTITFCCSGTSSGEKRGAIIGSNHDEDSSSTVKGNLSLQVNNGSGLQTALSINHDSYVTKPQQPSFAAYRNVSDYVVNAGAKFEFNTTRHNVGNHYSTSNHRFTAPVAGSYQFNFYTIYRGNVTSAYVRLYKNGARMYGGDIHFTYYDLGSNWDNVDFSQVVYLSASDYVEIYNGNSGNITYHGNHWQLFSGWLLG